MDQNPKKSKAFIITFVIVIFLLVIGYLIFANSDKIFGTKGSSAISKVFAPLLGSSKQKNIDVINGGQNNTSGTGSSSSNNSNVKNGGGSPSGVGGSNNGTGGVDGSGDSSLYTPPFNPAGGVGNLSSNLPFVSLTSSSSSLPANGGTIQLTVHTSNVTSCVPSWASTSRQATDYTSGDINITKTTTFSIACTDDKTTTSASATVLVGGPSNAIKVNITASLQELPEGGGKTKISWTSEGGATSCIRSWATGNAGANNKTGEDVSLVRTTTLSIVCSGGGSTGSDSLTVVTRGSGGAPYVTLSADPSWIPYGGGNTTVSWEISNTKNESSCTGDWKTGKLSGSKDTIDGITKTKKLIISCVDSKTNIKFNAETTVIVPTTNIGFYISYFSAEPSSFDKNGGDTKLSWETNGVNPVCTGNWNIKNASGKGDTVTVKATKNFTLDCTDGGAKNSAIAAVVVTDWVNPIEPICVNFQGETIDCNSNDPDTTITQCSNAKDDDGDGKIDALDPGCHTDLDTRSASTYDPKINDESRKNILVGPQPQNECDGDPLVFTKEEQTELDNLLRQFYRIAPFLKTADDVLSEIDTKQGYQALIDEIKDLTNQCYEQKNDPSYKGPQEIKNNPFYTYKLNIRDSKLSGVLEQYKTVVKNIVRTGGVLGSLTVEGGQNQNTVINGDVVTAITSYIDGNLFKDAVKQIVTINYNEAKQDIDDKYNSSSDTSDENTKICTVLSANNYGQMRPCRFSGFAGGMDMCKDPDATNFNNFGECSYKTSAAKIIEREAWKRIQAYQLGELKPKLDAITDDDETNIDLLTKMLAERVSKMKNATGVSSVPVEMQQKISQMEKLSYKLRNNNNSESYLDNANWDNSTMEFRFWTHKFPGKIIAGGGHIPDDQAAIAIAQYNVVNDATKNIPAFARNAYLQTLTSDIYNYFYTESFGFFERQFNIW